MSPGLRLARGTRVYEDGAVLVGAGTVLFLGPRGATAVASLPGPIGGTGPSPAFARRLLDTGLAVPWWRDPPPADEAVDDVTVVVPVLDRPGPLAALLAALPDVPVLVVDDGSREPATIAAVVREHGARLLRHAGNRGPAAARNTGLRAVRTPYVAFCDSDVLPRPGWLGTLRRHLDDPEVALVAPRVVGLETLSTGWVEGYERARSSLDLGPDAAGVRVHGRVAYLPSACLVGRVSALGDGFEESLRAGEDVDLVWRLLEDGWSVRYEPSARVGHDHRVRIGPWLRRKAFYGTSAAPLAARHPGAVAPLVLAPWSTLAVAALLAQRRWSPFVALAAYALATAQVRQRLASSARPTRTAAALTAQGMLAACRQTGSALTRHYWPVAVLAATRSRPARRALLVAAVADGAADWLRVRPDLDPVRYVVARRLDDLAYGAGLWAGAIRARSVRALLPTWHGRANGGS